MVEVTPVQPRSSILKLSLGIALGIFVAIVAVILLSGATAEAATCTLTSTSPITKWSTGLNRCSNFSANGWY
jgi:ABC-type lipoprotein release transport system permease subunit